MRTQGHREKPLSQLAIERRQAPVAIRAVPALLALAALALALRCIALGRVSLWNDELFSLYFAQQGPGYILGPGRWIETNPPLYYLLLFLWERWIGSGDVALRALSVALSVATLVPLYLAGRALADARSGLIAAALFAASGLHILYAQEARPYALFTLTAAIALFGAARFLRSEPARLPIGGAAVFTLGSVLAVYAHDAAVFLVLALDAALFLAFVLERQGRRLMLLIAANFVIVLAAAPQLQVMLAQTRSPNLAWLDHAPGPAAIAAVAEELLTGLPLIAAVKDHALTLPGVVLAGAGVLLLAGAMLWAFARALVRHRHDPPVIALCFVVPVIGAAALIGVSAFRPIFLTRTALWLTLPLYLGAAIGLAELRPARRGAALATMLLLELGFGAAALAAEEIEPWRPLVVQAASVAAPGDVVVLTSEPLAQTPAIAFLRYWPERPLPPLRRWEGCGGPCPQTAEAAIDARAAPAPPIDMASLRDLLAGGAGIWIVSRTPGGARDGAALAPLERGLASSAHATATLQWGDKIRFTRWQS